MSEKTGNGSIREQIESLLSRQAYHERLARRHREAAIRIWRQRALLELTVDEGVKAGASSKKARSARVDGR